MTHEYLPGSEHTHGPEADERLPDARTVPVFAAPTDSDAETLLGDLSDYESPYGGTFTAQEMRQHDQAIREAVERGEL